MKKFNFEKGNFINTTNGNLNRIVRNPLGL